MLCKGVRKSTGAPCKCKAVYGDYCAMHSPERKGVAWASRRKRVAEEKVGVQGADALVRGFPQRIKTRVQLWRANEVVAIAVAQGHLAGREKELNTLNMALKNMAGMLAHKASQADELAKRKGGVVLSLEDVVRSAARKSKSA